LSVVPFRGRLPATVNLYVGMYRTTSDGIQSLERSAGAGDRVNIGRFADEDLRPFALPAPATGAVPFGNAMTLLSSSVRHSGGQLAVDLEWLAERAYESDYTVSVQARGDGWQAQHDGTPALGAIPTLKWLPGMTVHDRHRMELPPEVAPDDAFEVRVVVYDAFNMDPLPVTDAELVRQGQGQAVLIHQHD
jgi:hypothetical protein